MTLPHSNGFATAGGRLLAALLLTAGAILAGSGVARAGDGRWQAVLVAGDDAQPVFDNAVRALARLLGERGVPAANIHRFSAAPRGRDVEPAAIARLTRRIAGLPVQPGDRCLVFITSHGAPREGVRLAFADEMLSPADLAGALSGNCAAVPTVVIVSSCYSGSFARGAMTAPNRIVVTAARADRPSFGCEADRTYTVFDECLLGAWSRAEGWPALFDGTKQCVITRERALRVLPSMPQAWFGAGMRRLPGL